MRTETVAIIGSGISGLSAAYLLQERYDVTVFEKNDRLGGHSRTITVPCGHNGEVIPVDTGFIVFNKRNYPAMTRLFAQLDVPIEKSDMSFGVSVGNGALEYGSKGMFAQKRNLLKPKYWQMIFDILRFNRTAPKLLNHQDSRTLGEYLDQSSYGEWFCKLYLEAMGAAIWSCSSQTIRQFPLQSFLRFFANHGLLTVNDHPQWYTVSGGSREYIKRITASYQNSIRLNCGVSKVQTNDKGVTVTTVDGKQDTYNHVIFACHSDQALTLLDAPTPEQERLLSACKYSKNHIIVHSDESFMPQCKGAWASWVYLAEKLADKGEQISLTYWMNTLQNLKTERPVFVTLNPSRKPDNIHDEHTFMHPVFTQEAVAAQSGYSKIQGDNGIWFCGAYHRNGFHEDGLQSAITVTQGLGVNVNL